MCYLLISSAKSCKEVSYGKSWIVVNRTQLSLRANYGNFYATASLFWYKHWTSGLTNQKLFDKFKTKWHNEGLLLKCWHLITASLNSVLLSQLLYGITSCYFTYLQLVVRLQISYLLTTTQLFGTLYQPRFSKQLYTLVF